MVKMDISDFTGRNDRVEAIISLLAAYAGNILFPTGYYMSGVVYVGLLDYYHEDPVKTSLVGALNGALLCLLGPIVGILINIYSCRVVVVTGSIVVACACFVSAFVNSVDWLIVTYGIIGGIGNALAGQPLGVVLGFCFTKHRDTILCLSSVMIGFGMLISSPLAIYTITRYGIRGMFVILSAINLNMCVVGMLLKPSVLELHIQRQRKLTASNSTTLTAVIRSSASLAVDLSFMLFLLSTLSWNLMVAVCQMHLPNYMITKGADSSDISSIMICFSISNTVGRLIGALTYANSNVINPLKIHIVALATSGCLTMAFPVYEGILYSEYILAASTGMLTGIPNAMLSPMAIAYLGVENMSLAFGFTFLASGLGYVSGPPIASALYQSTGFYDASFLFAGSINLAGSLSAFVSFLIFNRKHRPLQSDQDPPDTNCMELLDTKEKTNSVIVS